MEALPSRGRTYWQASQVSGGGSGDRAMATALWRCVAEGGCEAWAAGARGAARLVADETEMLGVKSLCGKLVVFGHDFYANGVSAHSLGDYVGGA